MQAVDNPAIFLSQLEDRDGMEALIHKYHLGFESYEFGSGQALDHFSGQLANFEAAFHSCCRHGLSLHGPFLDLNPGSYDSLIRQATWRRFQDCYSAARLLGATSIVFHTGFFPEIYYPEGWASNSISFWKEFLHDKDASIGICLENHHDSTPYFIARVLEGVDHPAFSACLDIGHANIWSAVSLETWVDILRPHIRHLHINNNDGKKDSHNALHDGTIPMARILEYLLTKAPNARWVLELCGVEAVEPSLRLLSCILPSLLSTA